MASEGGFDGVNLIVGGIYYSLTAADIRRFPNSYFAHLLKDEWNADKTAAVRLDRDGALFRHIHYYIYTNNINIEFHGVQSIADVLVVLEIKREADFYILPKLVHLCNFRMNKHILSWCCGMIPTERKRKRSSELPIIECVGEGPEAPTYPLVHALLPLRPSSSVATARMDSHTQDLATAPVLEGEPVEEPNFYKCEYHHHSVIEEETLERLKTALAVWPLRPDTRLKLSSGINRAFEFEEGAYCTQRLRENTNTRLGTLLYIFNSNFTGGTISSSINGNTVSISQPGECMALLPGCSYSVDVVTSGTLLLVEFDVCEHMIIATPEQNVSQLTWTVHNPGITDIDSTMCTSICTALNATLVEHDSVVYCLSQYYDIVHTLDCNRYFETNPDHLVGIDAALYTMLCEHYNIEVVTVYAEMKDNYQVVSRCAVVDFIDSTHTTISSHTELDSDATVNNFNNAPTTTNVCKVITPRYGCGHAGPMKIGADDHTEVWSSVLTGLMISKMSTN